MNQGNTETIVYQINTPVTVLQVLGIYADSGLTRPTDELRVKNMIEHASIIITAWDGTALVGFLRALTDFSFDCYLNDLAVHRNYQGKGIGKELVELLKNQLEGDVMIFVISSKEALQFYPKIGFRHFSSSDASSYLITETCVK